MAASKGFTGSKVVFKIGTTAVAQVKTLQLNGQKVTYEDISNLDTPLLGSSAVPLKEKLPVTAEPGTLAIGGIYLPADTGYLALVAAYESQALSSFTIQLPKGPGQTTTGNLFTFSGFISELPLPDVQWDKTLTFKTTIELNTDIAITPGS
jgi:hypothetical protein